MMALALMVVFVGLGILIGVSISPEATWHDWYKGALGGLLVSAILLHLHNKRTRAKELQKEKEKNMPRKKY